MNTHIAKIILSFSIVIMVTIVGMEIVSIDSHGRSPSRFAYSGHIFTISLLMIFWSIYSITRDRKPGSRSAIIRTIKVLVSCYAIGGVLFLMLSVLAFFSFGHEGLTSVTSNMFYIVLAGMIISAPFVIRRLR